MTANQDDHTGENVAQTLTSSELGSPNQTKVAAKWENNLPPALLPGGVVERCVQMDTSITDEECLHAKILADLKDTTLLCGCYGFKWPIQKSYEMALLEIGDGYRYDPVLRYSLGANESMLAVERKFIDKAWAAYREKPLIYNAILGDLVSPCLQQGLPWDGYRNAAHTTAAADWPVYCQTLRTRCQRSPGGIGTGFGKLDASLGGLSGMIVIGGMPGIGKTTLALSLAIGALRRHRNLAVLHYLFDNMSKTTLYDRLVCQVAGIESSVLTKQSRDQDEQRRFDSAMKLLADDVLPRLRIVESNLGQEALDVDVMRRSRDRLMEKASATCVLTIIDYFQRVNIPKEPTASLEADHRRIKLLDKFQAATRSAAMPAGDPLLVVSEVRKGESGRMELTTADLLGSSRLGYAPDAVLLLEQADGDANPAKSVVPLVLRIDKGRDRVTRTQIPLLFEHRLSRFRERGADDSTDSFKETATNRPDRDPFAGKK